MGDLNNLGKNEASNFDEEFIQLHQEELNDACAFDSGEDYGRPLNRMETIYESFEEDDESSDDLQKDVVMVTNPTYSSDDESKENASTSLKWNVKSWCETTGLAASIVVICGNKSFKLHKFPLVSRSAYFKRILAEKRKVKLPEKFPGNAGIFQMIANFCYGSTILVEPANVASLRCAAEYLEMGEDLGKGNLCELSDLYLNQVALKTWEGALTVLRSCEELLPLAEEFLIVPKCVDSMAVIACKEMANPKSGFDTEKEASGLWVEDLLALPLKFFSRIVAAFRRHGMEEKSVSAVIMKFVQRWILCEPVANEQEMSLADYLWCQDMEEISAKTDRCRLLEAVVRLLPMEKYAVPVGFLFSLLRSALALDASLECKLQLETRIASQLDVACMEDFLMPVTMPTDCRSRRSHIESMRQIVSLFMSQQILNEELKDYAFVCNSTSILKVAQMWDMCLAEAAYDSSLSPGAFSDLVDAVPNMVRISHDSLYKAIHIYLKAHPHVAHSERVMVCKPLNCQKLSQEVCLHAVQNELMPLRTIVQAMFLEQIQGKYVGSSNQSPISKDRGGIPMRSSSHRFQRESGYVENGIPLSYALQAESSQFKAAYLHHDFEATKCRLKHLEKELAQVKKCLQSNPPGQTREHRGGSRAADGSCIGQMLHTQRRIHFGHKILRTFQKLGGSLWKGKCYDPSDSVNLTRDCCSHSIGNTDESMLANFEALHVKSDVMEVKHGAERSQHFHGRSHSLS